MIGERIKVCPKCSTEHSCYAQDCWCNDYPAILPMNPDQDCYCSTCLKTQIVSEINLYMTDLTPDKIKKVQALGKPSQYVKDVDFTINADGNWVFSSWYLLRQGGCCSKGCQNCPYRKS